MQPKSIGIDIDGVIADSFPVIVELVHGAFGNHVTVDQWRWKLEESYGITSEEELRFWDATEEEIYQRTLPVEGALLALQTLISHGCTPHYITARSPRFRPLTEEWLAKHGFPPGKLIFSLDKGQVCREHGVSVFFEDSPHFVGEGYPPTLLFDYPYNRHINHPTIRRVSAWPEALEAAKEILKIR